MGKMDDFNEGRKTGMSLALKIVEKDGVDGLRKEMRWRNWSKINTSLSSKELDKAFEAIKEMTLDTVQVLACAVLHDEFGFGNKRLQQFADAFNKKAGCLADGFCTWQDWLETIKEETGIELSIRYND